ncbi:MAG: hypothetical protein JWO05_2600 [Gemmatimonadetes bacterium]|nr:hypothetical protein [Gemmatimonadota bacterium]
MGFKSRLPTPTGRQSLPRHGVRNTVAALALLAAGACHGFESQLTAGGPDGRARADQLFSALGARYTQLIRTPRYDSARFRLAHASLMPSRVFDDSTTWTARTADTRTLTFAGHAVNGRYVMDLAPGAPLPVRPGDSRHVVALTKLDHDGYAWDTDVHFSVGSIGARDVGDAIAALLSAAEGRSGSDVIADVHASFPATSKVASMLFSLDSVRPVLLADGSTQSSLLIRLHPDRMRARFPDYGDYLTKYLASTTYHISVTDRAGAQYLEAIAQGKALRIRVRTKGGEMLPLGGGTRVRPDSLLLTLDLSTKVRMFTLGLRKLVMDFTVGRSAHERSWTFVAHTDPEWDLPFVTERLLRSPLRRPFQGAGSQFRLAVRDSVNGPTLVSRHLHVVVQESAIFRFLSALSGNAIDDFQKKADKEEDEWLRMLFEALRADIR